MAKEKAPKTKISKNKFFRRPIKEKKLNKKFVKYIQLEADKKFFLSCFTLEEGDIISPVAFICVPRRRLPNTNLSKAKRGNFTTR